MNKLYVNKMNLNSVVKNRGRKGAACQSRILIKINRLEALQDFFAFFLMVKNAEPRAKFLTPPPPYIFENG